MARRENAEGTIFQRGKDGRWVAGIMLDNGKRKFVYGATREEVASKLPSFRWPSAKASKFPTSGSR